METPRFLKRLLGLRDPRRAASLVAKGVVHARQGDLGAALHAYKDALASDDTYALAHLNVALCLQDVYNGERASLPPEEHAGRLTQMAHHLRAALELDPRLTPGLRALGFVERGLGNHRAARLAFERYLEEEPGQEAHRARVMEALKDVMAKAQLEENLEVGLAVVEHVDERDERARADAYARFEAVAKEEPHRAQVWWAMGMLKKASGDFLAAQQCLERALKADPGWLPAHKELSALHFHAGSAAKALPHAQAAFEGDPTSPALVCNLGVCHLSLGNLDPAQEFIELAKSMAPKDPIVANAVKALEDALKSAVG